MPAKLRGYMYDQHGNATLLPPFGTGDPDDQPKLSRGRFVYPDPRRSYPPATPTSGGRAEPSIWNPGDHRGGIKPAGWC